MNNIEMLNGGRLSRPPLKQPPYGRQLLEEIKSGNKPTNDIFLFVGDYSWKKASAFIGKQAILVLPPEDEPQNYCWGVVKTFPVLVFDTSGVGVEVIRLLAYLLLKYGASVVRVVTVAYSLLAFRQGGSNGK